MLDEGSDRFAGSLRGNETPADGTVGLIEVVAFAEERLDGLSLVNPTIFCKDWDDR